MATLKISSQTLIVPTVTNLQSLASSSTLLAGWESDLFDNTTNKAMDARITGVIKAGTTITAGKVIEIWLYRPYNIATPLYPDVLTGAQSARTLTSDNLKNAGLRRAAAITVDSTNSQLYPFDFTLSEVFNAPLFDKFGLFITHSMGNALASSGNIINIYPNQYDIS